MWQYTTETIINSSKGHLGTKKDKRFAFDGGKLLIEGVGSFDPRHIAAVYRTPYLASRESVATITIPTTALVANDTVRLQIWISEEGSIRPELQNAFLMKKLPFQFEIELGVVADVAEELAAAAMKVLNKKGAEKLFTVSGASNALTITATDCYIRINEVRVDKTNVAPSLLGYQDYQKVIAVKASDNGQTAIVQGREGNGTVARLVKNLRIPTSASLNPFGSDHGGKPVPGGEYDQYLIQYVVDRSHMGHQVIGSVADKSMTSHVLFIEKGAITDFEAALNAAGVQATAADPSALQNAEVGTLAKEVDPKPTKR
jgi:hypothetical protein